MVAPLAAGRITRSMVRIPGSGTDEAAGLICLNLGNVSSFAGMIQVPQNLSLTTRNGRQQIMSSLSVTPTNEKIRGKPTSSLNDDTTNSEEKVDSPPQTLADDALRTTSVDVITSVVNNCSSHSSTGRNTNSTDVSGARHKRPFRQDSAEEPPVIPKRYKAMVTTLSGTLEFTGRPPILLPVVTSSRTPTAVPISHCSNGSASTLLLPGVMSQSSLPRGYSVQQMVQERDQLKRENVSLKRRLFLFHKLLRNKQKLHIVLRHLEAVPS